MRISAPRSRVYCWIALASGCALLHTPLAAQAADWELVATTGPAARSGHAMAYDSSRGRTLLFGGVISGPTPVGDTWEWDGGSWMQVPQTGPSPRHRPAMAYDSQRGRIVLHGGWTYPVPGWTVFSDTWEWDGTTWTQVTTAGPGPRKAHTMAYDSQRGRTVLFGGSASLSGLPTNDTWAWDGSTWMQIATAGPMIRQNHVMAYDSQRDRMVVFGGNVNGTSSIQYSDTWESDGTSWTLASTSGPPALRISGMAYDSQRGRTVLFGGRTASNTNIDTTWEWDGSAWAQVPVTGPSAREWHSMAYDSQRQCTVLFSGKVYQGSLFADTWEYGTNARFTSFGAGCPGSPYTSSQCAQLNSTGGALTGATAPLEFGILASPGTTLIESFDLYTQSTGGTQTVPAHIYPTFGTTPLASTTITVTATPGFHTATFPTPVPVSSHVFLAIDVSAQSVVVPDLTIGSFGAVYERTPPTGSWAFSFSVNAPAYRVTCRDYATPALGNTGDPILGATYGVSLSNALPLVGAIVLTGFSDTVFHSLTLPYPLPGAPGCWVFVAPDATLLLLTSPTGTATHSIAVPSSSSYIGLELFHQWAVLDAANPLGIVVSNAGRARLGT